MGILPCCKKAWRRRRWAEPTSFRPSTQISCRLMLAKQGGFGTCIHIDRVEGLGNFMELEVVLRSGQTDAEGAALGRGADAGLGLAGAERIGGGYLDLLPR